MATAQGTARREGAKLLVYPSMDAATLKDFNHDKLAIFIHGFTADSRYMVKVMHQFDGAGYRAIAFEYPSDRGIDYAASELWDLLSRYDANDDISKHRVVLIGHSMGGLVARAFIAFQGGTKYARKVITLGSPNDGTLRDAMILRFFLDWGEAIGGFNPWAFKPQAVSAQQLLQADLPQPLLDRLNSSPLPVANVQFFSMSGGLPALNVGNGFLRNHFAHMYLQMRLSKPNDGLVEEDSSDLSGPRFRASAPNCVHIANYTEYWDTNHSHLVSNQTLGLEAVLCAR